MVSLRLSGRSCLLFSNKSVVNDWKVLRKPGTKEDGVTSTQALICGVHRVVLAASGRTGIPLRKLVLDGQELDRVLGHGRVELLKVKY